MQKIKRAGLGLLLALSGWPLLLARLPDADWRYYGGDQGSSQYSALDQINKGNVNSLEVAWTYDISDGEDNRGIKCNPLIIDGILYGVTTMKNPFAIDARTGLEKWVLDLSQFPETGRPSSIRGMNYWENGDDKRLLYVYGRYLYAINATTGRLIEGFGEGGRIHFSTGIVSEGSENRVSLSTPGVVYGDLLIVGSTVSERLPAAPGDIRAFNVITGELVWIFHTIPRPGEFGYETWPEGAYKEVGGANSWGGMSLDPDRGIVYVPTGSPTYDFYGANRIGTNLFGNCLLALDAKTGRRIWHYQLVHHDLWDRDISSPPNLITVHHDGRDIDAVAQVTKQGYVYLFNRETGEPLFEIEEIPVPASVLPGEVAWPTQPIPKKPPPFARQGFGPDDVTDLSPEATAYVTAEMKKYKGAPFTPPDTEGILLAPGITGGANWSGAAFDQSSGLLYVSSNDFPWLVKLIDTHEPDEPLLSEPVTGKSLYMNFCAGCHGESGQGMEYVPSIEGLKDRSSMDQVVDVIVKGRGLMPPSAALNEDQVKAISSYILEIDVAENAFVDLSGNVEKSESVLRYTHRGYQVFRDQEGYPASKRPWSTVTAIDMNKGEIKWQVPLGEYEELVERGITQTGTTISGGLITTGGGLVFIGATRSDQKFRAFDKDTGQTLWELKLNGSVHNVPATYAIDGKQYLVFAVTGMPGKGFKDHFMALKLPARAINP